MSRDLGEWAILLSRCVCRKWWSDKWWGDLVQCKFPLLILEALRLMIDGWSLSARRRVYLDGEMAVVISDDYLLR